MQRRLRAFADARWRLAELHSSRTLVLACGLRPWRALVARARANGVAAAAHRRAALVGRALGGWCLLVRRRRAAEACAAAVEGGLTRRAEGARARRAGLRRLRAAAARHGACVRAARRRLNSGFLRRVWAGWVLGVRLAAERREVADLQAAEAAAARLAVARVRRAVGRWRRHADGARLEHAAESCREELWAKVHGWLDELRADDGEGAA